MKDWWTKKLRYIRRAMNASTLNAARMEREVARRWIRMLAHGAYFHPLYFQGILDGWYCR